MRTEPENRISNGNRIIGIKQIEFQSWMFE